MKPDTNFQALADGTPVTMGATYRDVVSGLTGVATGHCRYISGCDHVSLSWVADGERKSEWFDIVRLIPVPGTPVVVLPGHTGTASAKVLGGPAPHPHKQ